LVAPADIFGLSKDVISAQLYWSGGAFDAQLIFKHRSQYFQQFIDSPGRIRYVDDNSVIELRASYKLNDAVTLSFEALNLTDEPRVDFRGVDGNVSQVLSYGPRYFFGIKAKL
ncbi:MAG: TonB-dependent receptor, partial [Acidiferrobacterales bacterium]|nr:TonB-dependent receptor [Acidiferrobacterales bacterium]